MAKVAMVLAQGPGQPDGDIEDRLALQVQLNAVGQLDRAAWTASPLGWAAVRSRPDHPEQAGEVALIDGEADGFWAVRRTHGEDEPLWVLESDVVRPGEIVAVRSPDGVRMLYRIVAVERQEG
ncbi:MAG: hypothetical protein ACRYGC_02580 [Janthinobacterium lividum]